MADMTKPASTNLAGEDEPLRRARLEEKEEFDAEYRAQIDAEETTEWVVYRPIPGLDYREITIAEWKKAGVDVEESQAQYVRWDGKNEWRLPRQMLNFLSEEQFNQYIMGDGRFHVEDAEDADR